MKTELEIEAKLQEIKDDMDSGCEEWEPDDIGYSWIKALDWVLNKGTTNDKKCPKCGGEYRYDPHDDTYQCTDIECGHPLTGED